MLKFTLAFILSLMFFSAASAKDLNSAWSRYENISARIINRGERFGVEIKPDNGWYTYYKVSGDAGIPTEFDFSGSKNLKVKEVVYPPYKTKKEYGLRVNVYDKLTFFPIKAERTKNSVVKIKVTGAVCNNICIPYELNLPSN